MVLKEGIDPAGVQAIRQGCLPEDSKFAKLSALAKTMIEKRGRLNDEDVDRFLAAGFGKDHLLEGIATSTITIVCFARSVCDRARFACRPSGDPRAPGADLTRQSSECREELLARCRE